MSRSYATASYIWSGSGRSRAAEDAELRGSYPLSRAIPIVARVAGVTKAKAREALRATWGGEWHHTGLYARRTDYYSVTVAIKWLAEQAEKGASDVG